MTSYQLYPSLKEGHLSDLAIFSAPRQNSAVDEVNFVRFKPTSALSLEPTEIVFSISNVSSKYIDLSRSRLTLECKVVNGDNSNIVEQTKEDKEVNLVPKESRVGICMYPIHTLFHTVELSIQNQVISPHVANNYHYKAIIDSLCRNDLSPGELAAGMWYKDDYEFIQSVDTGIESGNQALAARRLLLNSSRRFTVSGVINHDICKQGRLILNNVPINLRFSTAKHAFVLVSSLKAPEVPTFKVQITDASYDVCFVKPSASVLVSQNRVLHEDKKAMYPYLRSVIKTVNVPFGARNFSVDDVFSSFIPADLFCVFVDAESYSGSYLKNPFFFENVFVDKAGCYLEGQSVPQRPYETSFVKDKWYLSSFLEAFMGLLGSDPKKCNISYQEFSEAFCIFRWELEKYTDEIMPRSKRGHLRVEFNFSEPLGKNYVMICYGLFSSLMLIDKARSITLID